MEKNSKNKFMDTDPFGPIGWILFCVFLGVVLFSVYYLSVHFKHTPQAEPCQKTFLILEFRNRAILTIMDCESGGTIEVDAQVPCFDSGSVNRILYTARKQNKPKQENSVFVQHDNRVLRISYNGSRKELTDTIVSVIKNFTPEN